MDTHKKKYGHPPFLTWLNENVGVQFLEKLRRKGSEKIKANGIHTIADLRTFQ